MKPTAAHAIFVLAVAASLLLGSAVPSQLVVAVAAGNLFAFAAFAYDKLAAQQSAARVPEVVLQLMGLLGVAGAAAGRLFFRHKTQHVAFGAGHVICSFVTTAVAVHLG